MKPTTAAIDFSRPLQTRDGRGRAVEMPLPLGEIADRYRAGETARQIAVSLSVCNTAIYDRLRALGISRRKGGPRERDGNASWKGGILRPSDPKRYVRVLTGKKKYTSEHVVIAEQALGRPLPAKAEVHHVNRIRHDNSRGNLVICPDNAYHKLLHTRQRIKDAGGDPNTRKQCGTCRAVLPFSSFTINKRAYLGLSQRCRECIAAYDRSRRIRLRLLRTVTEGEGLIDA